MAQEETEMQSILDQSCLLDGVRLAELIGSGSYAKVYRGRWKGIPVAVKQLHAIFSESGSSQREGLMHTFYKELGMNIKLRHPNIIQFLGVVLPRTDAATNGEGGARMAAGGGTPGRRGPGGGVEEFPMMVMELMHCTLEKRLSEYRSASTRMPLCESVDIAADIAAALVYLHGKEPRPIAHRDLAPKNVLLSPEGTAKLCDLGVAKWANSSRNNTQGPGTLPYMPPEVRISTHYLPVAVDTYSFGVTVLEMCSGLEPKPKDFAQMMPVDGTYQYQLVPDKIRREKSLSALQPNHPLETTIEQCLQTNADKRPTAEQLLYTMQSMKESKVYLESKKIVKTETCSSCKAKDEELSLIKEQLVERSRELLRLVEENKILKRLRDEQLQSLQVKLETTAEEGERYQQKIQEMQGMLQEQVKMNRGLEMSHDREKDINQLLMQKVEMDNNPSRFSHPPPHRSEKVNHCQYCSDFHSYSACFKPSIYSVSVVHSSAFSATMLPVLTSLVLPIQSMSVTCIDDQRPKPVPKPRKRRSDVAVRREQLNDAAENSFHSHADNLLKPGRLSSAISGSVPSLPKISPDLTGSGDNTYLQLDAVAMAGAQRARGRENSYVNVKRPHPLQTRKSNPMLLSENEEHRPAPLWSARSMLDFHTKADATFKISQPQPIPNGKSTTSENGHPIRRQSSRHLSISPPSSESNEIQDEHIYVEIPASGPPTPPPRDEISFQFHRGTTQSASWNSPRPTRLSIIDEKEESLKSPQLKTPGEWPDRMARSMRDKKTPLKEDPQNLAPPRPSFGRQSSRGDVLISRVQSSVKAKVSIMIISCVTESVYAVYVFPTHSFSEVPGPTVCA